MAKEEKKVEKSDRELRWEAFLAVHAKQSPAKHEARLKAGELDIIPDSFI
jgi:hypothetical protein